MFWGIAIVSILILTIFIYIFFKREKEISFITAYLIFAYICYFFGYVLIYIMFDINNTFRDVTTPDLLYETLFFSIIFFLFLMFFYRIFQAIFNKYKNTVKITFFIKKVVFYKIISFLMISISFLTISIYVIKSGGFTFFHMEDYTARFNDNAGLGYLRMFFSLYIVGFLITFLLEPTKKNYYKTFLFIIMGGTLIYLAMGGMRNVLFSGILSMIFLGINKKYISMKLFIFAIPIGIIVITFLALLRYSNEIELTEEIIFVALNYTIDSISPVYSLFTILNNFTEHFNFIGFEYFFNQFLSFVPRIFWIDKPLLLDTNAYFYTKEVLGYNRELIISPTSIGVFYMMFGAIGIIIGSIVLALFFYFLDLLKSNISILKLSIFYYFLPLTFWVGRGTLEFFMFKIILSSITIAIVYGLAIIIYKLIPIRSKGYK